MLFLNITNHPSDRWSAKQIAVAHSIGEIKDLPFPVIDETLNTEAVQALADKYTQVVLQIASPHDAVIHIMGEMTFTFALVSKLKALGYRCVASTSERIVEDLADGSKNVKFEFCQFRDY